MTMDQRHLQYLQAMGIQSWSLRGLAGQILPQIKETPVGHVTAPVPVSAGAAPTVKPVEEPPLRLPPGDTVHSYNWDQLKGAVRQCVACDLHATRKNTVFGVGDEQADWMVVGEAPGADEDRQGEPFVGRAGQLLNNMLLAMGLRREQVYIANILKCRPPNNRDPRPEEVVKCEPFLKRQVELVNPKIILAVGRVAAHNLLKTDSSLSNLRGKCFHYGDNETPLVVTYHPAYLLRSPKEKRKAWKDLLFAQSIIRGQR